MFLFLSKYPVLYCVGWGMSADRCPMWDYGSDVFIDMKIKDIEKVDDKSPTL